MLMGGIVWDGKDEGWVVGMWDVCVGCLSWSCERLLGRGMFIFGLLVGV